MKKSEWWGIEMNTIESFKFQKYLNEPTTPRPNTLTKEQRIELLTEFLKKIRN
jgi:hypothetical protein